MNTTIQWLDATRASRGFTSDYQLAKALGVSTQMVSNWRAGRNTLSDYAALRVAQLLDVDPMQVIAAVNAERAGRAERTDERRAWERVAKAAGIAAAALLVAMALPYQLGGVEEATATTVYYVKLLAPWLTAVALILLHSRQEGKQVVS